MQAREDSDAGVADRWGLCSWEWPWFSLQTVEIILCARTQLSNIRSITTTGISSGSFQPRFQLEVLSRGSQESDRVSSTSDCLVYAIPITPDCSVHRACFRRATKRAAWSSRVPRQSCERTDSCQLGPWSKLNGRRSSNKSAPS